MQTTFESGSPVATNFSTLIHFTPFKIWDLNLFWSYTGVNIASHFCSFGHILVWCHACVIWWWSFSYCLGTCAHCRLCGDPRNSARQVFLRIPTSNTLPTSPVMSQTCWHTVCSAHCSRQCSHCKRHSKSAYARLECGQWRKWNWERRIPNGVIYCT